MNFSNIPSSIAAKIAFAALVWSKESDSTKLYIQKRAKVIRTMKLLCVEEKEGGQRSIE